MAHGVYNVYCRVRDVKFLDLSPPVQLFELSTPWRYRNSIILFY